MCVGFTCSRVLDFELVVLWFWVVWVMFVMWLWCDGLGGLCMVLSMGSGLRCLPDRRLGCAFCGFSVYRFGCGLHVLSIGILLGGLVVCYAG